MTSFWTRTCAVGCLISLAAMSSGCSDLRSAFGLEKHSPDEFKVVRRAPLSMPPEFGLRPPTPGAARPQERSIRQEARQTVFRGEEEETTVALPQGTDEAGRTAGEVALLNKAGAAKPDPGIRRLVNQETTSLAEEDQNLVERLMFWRDKPVYGSVVDPEKETQRIRENQSMGRPINAGATPTIERKPGKVSLF